MCSTFGDFFLTVCPLFLFLLSVVTLGKQLDVSANGLGSDGGKAIAASIAENHTITSVSDSVGSNMRFYLFIF